MRIGRRSKSRRSLQRITLNLTSMIDVTFLLLIYFMVTTVLARQEDRLSPTLQTRQEDQAGPASDFQPQVVEVFRGEQGPTYRIGGRLMTERQQLESVLESLPTSAGVFIKVHDQVPVGFAVTAIQVARDAGFEQVTYVPAE
jgi:biopolymer transport protein ExbD